MKVTILNKFEARNYCPAGSAVIIRIDDVYPMSKLSGKYIEESQLFFSDTEDLDSDYCIQDDEADKIVQFVLKYIDVDEIVVHCVYAQGRSPAIALAIKTYLGEDVSFGNNYPDLNKLVFKKIMYSFLKYH